MPHAIQHIRKYGNGLSFGLSLFSARTVFLTKYRYAYRRYTILHPHINNLVLRVLHVENKFGYDFYLSIDSPITRNGVANENAKSVKRNRKDCETFMLNFKSVIN